MVWNSNVHPRNRDCVVGLVAGKTGFYGFGDPNQQHVEVVPRQRPVIVHEVPTMLPYRFFATTMEAWRWIPPMPLSLGTPSIDTKVRILSTWLYNFTASHRMIGFDWKDT